MYWGQAVSRGGLITQVSIMAALRHQCMHNLCMECIWLMHIQSIVSDVMVRLSSGAVPKYKSIPEQDASHKIPTSEASITCEAS